jgi:hypothetical protein
LLNWIGCGWGYLVGGFTKTHWGCLMVIFICAARQVHVAIKWKRTMYTVHHKSVEVGLVRVPIKVGGISS